MPLAHEPSSSTQQSWSTHMFYIGVIISLTLVGGFIGKFLSIPPGNICALWPPAGIAFISLFYLSRHYWPGVFLGSLIFNALFFHLDSTGITIPEWIACFAIATGSTLQALTSSTLGRKYTPRDISSLQLTDILKLLFIAGPLCCTIAATFGSISLTMIDIIPTAGTVNTWITWWFGDTLGVWVVSSVSLFLLRHSIEKINVLDNLKQNWGNWISVVLLCSILFITLYSWNYLRLKADEEDFDRFKELSHKYEAKIQERLGNYSLGLQGAVGLLYSSNVVTLEEWRAYIRALNLDKNYPGIWGIGFIDEVNKAQLPQYLESIKSVGIKHMTVKEISPTPNHSDVFIIRYIEPFERNEEAVGLDIGSEAFRRDAAESARDTGEERITGIIRLVQDNTRVPGFLLLLPVYEKNIFPINVKQRRKHFIGWVYAPFVGTTIFDDIVPENTSEVAFQVYDQSISDKTLIYTSQGPWKHDPQFQESHRFHFAGRDWLLRWSETTNFETTQATKSAQLTLIFGILFSSTLAGLLYSLASTRDKATALAHEATQELREAKDVAIRASEMKSSFLANMSHEIRTPLNGIISIAQLLELTELSIEQSRLTRILHNSSQNLLNIVNDILDFSKIESGKIQLESTAFEVRKECREILDFFESTLGKESVRFSLDVSPEVPNVLVGDEVRLKQILTNFLGNSVKFTKDGSITLRVRQTQAKPSHSKIRFEVEDTGCGIPEEKLPILFDAFTQADTSTTRIYGGTGLGLSICKKLVDLMGGTIGVSSQVEEGSLFWFEVDLGYGPKSIQDKYDTQTIRESIMPQKQRGLVLVVDDNPVNFEITKLFLDKLGFDTENATNGMEAIERSHEKEYDFILMDCHMPVMDGYTATRKIRESSKRNQETLIMAMTADAQAENYQKCLTCGMNEVLTKPIMLQALQQAMEKWITNAPKTPTT